MACSHRGYHRITSSYDRDAGVMVYVSLCEACGTSLGEVSRLPYRPRFLPLGNDTRAAGAGNPAATFTPDREPA
jgi:hypothetical protein